MNPIYIGADHDVTYSGAVPAAGGSYLNAATVTFALKNAAGTTLASGTLSYVGSSNGNYAGVIQSTDTASLTEGTTYYVEITFSQSTYQDFRRLAFEAAYRTEF